MLEFDRLRVAFPGVLALDDVSFAVRAGSVHALLGANGAGKSTLLKTLAGVVRPSAGGVRIDGRTLRCGGSRDAMEAGIAVIHQELNLVPQLSVAENLLLGQLPRRLGFVDRAALRATARAQLERLGEDIDPDARVGDLSIGRQQMIEIGKALLRKARVIAMDEPTSSLSAREVDSLMRIVAELKAQGKAVLYVSHRMDEIYRACDSATVLRDGRHVSTRASLDGVGTDALVGEMVGRPIRDVHGYRPRALGPEVLAVQGVAGPGLRAPLSLTLRRGEILGLFGLMGAGRTSLLKLLYGARRRSAGRVLWRGRVVDFRSPSAATAAGWGLCPEDRKREGVVADRSVNENLHLGSRRCAGRLGGWVDGAAEAAVTQRYIEALSIRTPGTRSVVRELSGGNQQKVILARWLAQDCELFLMDEPTRGIDVGARADIYDILLRQAEAGRSILVASSEADEVAGICDRVLVLREGALAGELARDEATPQALLKLALPRSGGRVH